MSIVSPIDYPLGRSFIESFMVDRCTITRQAAGVESETLNTTTGVLSPVAAPVVQYSGQCLLKKPKAENQPQVIAGQYNSYSIYKVLVPFTVTGMRFGDMLTVTQAQDPTLLAHKMRVVDVWSGTHAVYRAFYTIDLTAGLVTPD